MNQITSPAAYLPLGENILQGLGVATGVVTETTLEGLAVRARGSLRDYNHSVMMAGGARGSGAELKAEDYWPY